jgi:RimJ/RimL family protein N-acetyltransferase
LKTYSKELRTDRLLLRRWRPDDIEAYAAMNADSRVMEYFDAPLTREESDAKFGRIQILFQEQGFGMWAVEVVGEAPFVGSIGLNIPTYDAHFTPCIEVGWRLATDYWGRGIATEGARAVLEFGFRELKLTEIVSLTTVSNARSRRVMEKLAMRRDSNDDFDHPALPPGHRFRRHVLYRLASPAGGPTHTC